MSQDTNQWASVKRFLGVDRPSWMPPEDRDRVAAYNKYDELYWNEPRQFALRVLEGEQPLYIPNARTIVDTTAHYILKGLTLETKGSAALKNALQDFLVREMFFARFHAAKHTGVARGDFYMHLTANPSKAPGTRLSLNEVHPSMVFPIWDEDDPEKMVGCNIAVEYYTDDDPEKTRIRKLTYKLVEVNGQRRVSREEGIYELEPKWYGKTPKLVKTIIPLGLLDARITAIPVYHFKNKSWSGEEYGSSELRGFESLLQAVSQGSTDVSAALSLEGLGVYATDGGRPVNDAGVETEWEVAPGRVMEVPSGSYFRRVEGVGSITPAKDQIDYIESKMLEGTSLTDVALGKVEAQVAASGIALAIRFMPTLAKVEQRDEEGVGKLRQLFYDWKSWHEVFEGEQLEGDIIPTLGDKLPIDRVARVNELNNMFDRRIISTKYYRDEMMKLGYVFPPSIQKDIDEDLKRNQAQKPDPETPSDPNEEEEPPSEEGSTLEKENSSNNRERPNESSGTESK